MTFLQVVNLLLAVFGPWLVVLPLFAVARPVRRRAGSFRRPAPSPRMAVAWC